MKIANYFFEQNLTKASPVTKLWESNNLPVKASYSLSKLLQKLEPLNKIFMEERKKIIEKWCDKDFDNKPIEENGQYRLVQNLNEFMVDYQELLSMESDIDMNIIEIDISMIPIGILNSYDFNQLKNIILFKEE